MCAYWPVGWVCHPKGGKIPRSREREGGEELASLAHIINILNIILVLSSSLDWCCHVAAVSASAAAAV